MPNLLVAGNSTNGGTAISTDTSGTLNIVTGSGSGATAVTVDGSGNVVVTGTLTASGGVSGANSLKAWVNFNGTGTVAIRASGNVTSITDGGTGDYTVNFTTAMTDANYAAVFGGQGSTGASLAYVTGRGNNATLQQTTTTLNISTSNGANAATDPLVASVAIFR